MHELQYALILPPVLPHPHRVPVNFVGAVVMFTFMGSEDSPSNKSIPTVFKVLAGLTGVATLVQVNNLNTVIAMPPLVLAYLVSTIPLPLLLRALIFLWQFLHDGGVLGPGCLSVDL